MSEIWKAIPGFGGYEASSLGSIRRSSSRVIVPYHYQTKGYRQVGVKVGGKYRCALVHRLVALSHCDNPLGRRQVNHIDGNKDNNSASNLEWVTGRENMRHAVKNGLTARGEKNSHSVLNEMQVRVIRRARDAGVSLAYLSGVFGVSHVCISSIHLRKTWAHV